MKNNKDGRRQFLRNTSNVPLVIEAAASAAI